MLWKRCSERLRHLEAAEHAIGLGGKGGYRLQHRGRHLTTPRFQLLDGGLAPAHIFQ